MPAIEPEIVSAAGTRLRATTPTPFDVVRSRLEEQMGVVEASEATGLAKEAGSAEVFDRLVNERYVGSSGFMRFAIIDHGEWISLYGIHRRSERWILGNPLIAITMIEHDISAGLFAPVELLLTETSEGDGCTIDYVLPSSMIATQGAAPALLSAARKLDAKFEALIGRAVEAPAQHG